MALRVCASSADLPWVLSCTSASSRMAWATLMMVRGSRKRETSRTKSLLSLCLCHTHYYPQAKADHMDKSSVSVRKTAQERGSKEGNYHGRFFIPPNTLFWADSVPLFIYSTTFNEYFCGKAYSGLKRKIKQTLIQSSQSSRRDKDTQRLTKVVSIKCHVKGIKNSSQVVWRTKKLQQK